VISFQAQTHETLEPCCRTHLNYVTCDASRLIRF
jgi:hypothetical protein